MQSLNIVEIPPKRFFREFEIAAGASFGSLFGERTPLKS